MTKSAPMKKLPIPLRLLRFASRWISWIKWTRRQKKLVDAQRHALEKQWAILARFEKDLLERSKSISKDYAELENARRRNSLGQ